MWRLEFETPSDTYLISMLRSATKSQWSTFSTKKKTNLNHTRCLIIKGNKQTNKNLNQYLQKKTIIHKVFMSQKLLKYLFIYLKYIISKNVITFCTSKIKWISISITIFFSHHFLAGCFLVSKIWIQALTTIEH